MKYEKTVVVTAKSKWGRLINAQSVHHKIGKVAPKRFFCGVHIKEDYFVFFAATDHVATILFWKS